MTGGEACSATHGTCGKRPLVRAHPRQAYIGSPSRMEVPHSCARARTVASEVFTEAQSFADCKLHIRTRLLASAFSNFWKTFLALQGSRSRMTMMVPVLSFLHPVVTIVLKNAHTFAREIFYVSTVLCCEMFRSNHMSRVFSCRQRNNKPKLILM